MPVSQYKDYVLVMLFIKYVSDKYAGQPYAPITIPGGAGFTDMVALKGKPTIGDDINKKIIAPLANALSDADALIQSLTRLITKKRQIKQGAMQTLLNPYENGELKSGWVVKRLGDMSKNGRGRVISHRQINLAVIGKYPVFSSQTANYGIMGYIDTYDFDGDYVTWTTDGENAGKVFARLGKFICTNVCGTIKLIEGNLVFISLMLGMITPKHVSRNLTNPKLMNDPVKQIRLPILPIAHQNKIATILSDMDTEITTLESKLIKSQQIKQGMMQNLLTGRIRLVTPEKATA